MLMSHASVDSFGLSFGLPCAYANVTSEVRLYKLIYFYIVFHYAKVYIGTYAVTDVILPKTCLHSRFPLQFSPFDECERANQLEMSRRGITLSKHSLLIHFFKSIRRRK